MTQALGVPTLEAAKVPSPEPLDFITVLKSLGKKMAKTFDGDTVIPYDKAEHFTIETVPVSSIDELSMVLKYLAPKTLRCVIRGRFKGDAAAQTIAPPTRPGQYRRIGELFDEAPHFWWCADHDDFEPVLWDPVTHPEEAIRELIETFYPPEFQNASYHWQLSSSAGITPGLLKVHIWWYLATPYTGPQIRNWVDATLQPKVPGAGRPMLDIVTLHKVQVYYVANPVFLNGTPDPMNGKRCGLHRGDVDAVPLAIPEEMLAATAERHTGGGTDLTLVDATQKPGMIGAFCKAYPISRVINEVLPELFEYAGDDAARSLL